MSTKPHRFIVIALVEPAGDRQRGCRIVPQDAIYPDIYRQVFGPASHAECVAWVAAHCEPRPGHAVEGEPDPSSPGFAVCQYEAVGYSNDYSFGDALKDAINNLPPDPNPRPDKLYRYRVLESSAQRGGFTGIDRLYVRVGVLY